MESWVEALPLAFVSGSLVGLIVSLLGTWFK